MIEDLQEEIKESNKLLEISKLQQFKLQQSGALRRRSIEEHNERVEACERDIERLKSIISEAVKPAKSSIFSVDVAGWGWLWLFVAGCGCLWFVVTSCGWLWLAVAGCDWLWLVVTVCG